MRKLFLFLVLGVTLVACNENKPEQDASIAPLKSTTTNSTTTTSTYQNLPQQIPANLTTGIPQTQTTTPQNITAGVTAAGMNPAHGKPGHRCGIAVGAPLNSAAAKTATAPTTINQPATINQPTTTTQPAITGAKTVTAKGINPPHGEPGHRCDISVGAPLNSAPITAAKPVATLGAANITPTAVPSQNNAIVPALQNTSIGTSPKTTTAFTGKVNPAHGQPGHDCKVAVGQPLP